MIEVLEKARAEAQAEFEAARNTVFVWEARRKLWLIEDLLSEARKAQG